jgi:hypothetical protein
MSDVINRTGETVQQSPYKSMTNPAFEPPQPVSEVQSCIDGLSSNLGDLEHALARLIARLAPVLAPPNKTVSGGNLHGVPPSSCSLAQQIVSFTSRVQTATQQVNEALDTLGI